MRKNPNIEIGLISSGQIYLSYVWDMTLDAMGATNPGTPGRYLGYAGRRQRDREGT
jgi:hypothetical protein